MKNRKYFVFTKKVLSILSSAVLITAAPASLAMSQNDVQEVWRSAQQHYLNGNAQACYQSLAQLDSLFGNIPFDRLFGNCAQGAGESDQALLAYNRILSQQPQNADIRIERARVLYDLELYSESRKEFNWLLAKNPPAQARQTINNYSQAISRKHDRVKQYTSLKVSTTLGYDDNVNSAPEVDQFLGFVLNDTSRATSSSYYGASASIEHTHKLQYYTGLKLSASLSSKRFPDAEFIDQDVATAGIGYVQKLDRGTRGVDVLLFQQSVDSDFNSRGAIARLYYQHQLDGRSSVMPYLKAGSFRFSDNLLAKNINQYVYGVKYSRILNKGKKSNFSADLSYTHDYPIFIDSNYEVDIYSLKLNYNLPINDVLNSFSALQLSKFDYENAFFKLAFPEPRDDDLLNFQAGLTWKLSDNLLLAPTIGYKDFNSSVDVFTYKRWYADLGLSYKWIW